MADLAINGGPAAAADLDVPEWPQCTDRALDNVRECLESNSWCRISGGAQWVDRFEERFADYHDAEHAIAVSNGTVALQLALRACGVGMGDEVLVPSYTFIATASAVFECGAVPRMVDVDPETYAIDPDAMREAVTDRTVGAIGVHFSGYPIDFDRVLPVVEDEDLFLVEDCAHAHSTEWRGQRVGTVGDVGTFSFQDSKALASGEGGAVVTDDDDVFERAALLHNIGRDVEEAGYQAFRWSASNLRLSEPQGALLCGQLEKLPEENAHKQRVADRLRDRLDGVEGLAPKPRDERITNRGFYHFTVNYDAAAFDGLPRERFIDALVAEGVPANPTAYGGPLYDQQAFEREALTTLVPPGTDVPIYRHLTHPGAERVAEESVMFRHTLLLVDEREIDLVADAIEKVAANAGAVPRDPRDDAIDRDADDGE